MLEYHLSESLTASADDSIYRSPLTRSYAQGQAPIDELAIEGRARFLPSRFELLPGAGQVAGAAVEFAESGVKQVVVPQCWVLASFVERVNACLRTFDLGHDDCAIEQVHWRAMNREQGVIQAQDRRPIRFGIALRRAMMAGNGRFQMKRGNDGPLSRLIEVLLGTADQLAVPFVSVLLLQEQDGTALIEASV